MKVSFGIVGGKEWDAYTQKVLRLKFESEDYVPIPSKFGGDLGIESFSKGGKAFQSYCPDDEPTSAELYTKQRDKITRDTKKLVKNESNLLGLLGDTKIKKWYLVTPRYENKELIAHCEKKTLELRNKKCSHLDGEFRVLILTEDDFVIQQQILTEAGLHQITVEPSEIPDETILDWRTAENTLFENIYSKITKIPNVKNVDAYVDFNIKSYIAGQDMIEKIRRNYPTLHERLLSIKSSQEHKVELFSSTPTEPPGEYLKKCFLDYENAMTDGLGRSISRATITHLAGEAIADWLARCPLDF